VLTFHLNFFTITAVGHTSTLFQVFNQKNLVGINFSEVFSMIGLFDRNNQYILNDTTFETFFKWNSNWIPITITPIVHTKDLMHYIVHLPDEQILILRLNKIDEWEELKTGTTDQARAVGEAIDNFYKLVLS
jgi:hypothetical protein